VKARRNRLQAIGLALGVALFVAVGLLSWIGAGSADKLLKPGPIDPTGLGPAEQLSKAFAMVAAHVRPCVVSVYSEKTVKYTQPEFGSPFGDDFFRQFFGDQLPAPQRQAPRQREFRVPQRGMGSGMILDGQGHILTNFHVVRDVDEIKVQLADKRQFEAEIIGSDQQTDVAIIRIKGRVPDDLPAVTLGESGALQPGDLVMAIGAPFGLAQTVTQGIISAVGRSDVGIEDYEDFLQTDAPINPGNSGGPLVSMRGEVIGMNTAIATNIGQFAGVGFSIPSSLIKTMLPKLMKGEKIVRGQLGVVIQNLTKDLATQFALPEPKGALVAQVAKDSAAEKAGIKVGDVIVRYDGHDVQDVTHLRNLVATTAPGTQVKIAVIRHGKEESVTAAVGEQQAPAAAEEKPTTGEGALSKLGLSVQTLTPDLAKQFGVEAEKGVVITDVAEGSLASVGGLQRGDVITEADRQPVASAAELDQALAKSKNEDTVLLLVKRQGGSLFVVLQKK
jgi:serine protease Do